MCFVLVWQTHRIRSNLEIRPQICTREGFPRAAGCLVIVLLAILLLVCAYFFQVMAHFVVPLFLAAVLVVCSSRSTACVDRKIPGQPRFPRWLPRCSSCWRCAAYRMAGMEGVVNTATVTRFIYAALTSERTRTTCCSDVDAEDGLWTTLTTTRRRAAEQEGVNEQVFLSVV